MNHLKQLINYASNYYCPSAELRTHWFHVEGHLLLRGCYKPSLSVESSKEKKAFTRAVVIAKVGKEWNGRFRKRLQWNTSRYYRCHNLAMARRFAAFSGTTGIGFGIPCIPVFVRSDERPSRHRRRENFAPDSATGLFLHARIAANNHAAMSETGQRNANTIL